MSERRPFSLPPGAFFACISLLLTLVVPGGAVFGGIVRRQGKQFVLDDGTPFRPVGANLFWAPEMMVFNEQTRNRVRTSLDRLADWNANVIRVWAFRDGYDQNSRPIQPSPENYDEVRHLLSTSLFFYFFVSKSVL